MHPYSIHLWINLANKFNVNENIAHKKYFTICYHYINELVKHGYINRSEIINKQKHIYIQWVLNYLFFIIYNLKFKLL